jgi:hypothetical protein
MKKLLICLLLANTTYAFEGEGYKVLNEHFHSTFKNAHIEHLSNAQMRALDKSVAAHAYDAQGLVKTNIQVQSTHSVYVLNATPYVQRYHYKFELSCLQLDQYYSYDVELQPQGHFGDNSRNFGDVWNDRNVRLNIDATTSLDGDAFDYAASNGTLIITGGFN